MIRLKSERSSVAVHKNLRGELRKGKNRGLLEKFYGGGDFSSAFWKGREYWKDAKDQLKIETFGKCAYCEAPTDAVAHGDVEHFRPKSVYWWLAYCYDNFLFSCQICNQSFKSDDFPIQGSKAEPLDIPTVTPATSAEFDRLAASLTPDPVTEAEGVAWSALRKLLNKEKAHLPNPYEIDPEALFRWVADPVLREVRIAAANSRAGTRRAAEGVEKYLGLNREELLRLRWITYDIAASFKTIATDPGGSDIARTTARQQLKKMAADESEFAAMVRYFVKIEWQAPELLA